MLPTPETYRPRRPAHDARFDDLAPPTRPYPPAAAGAPHPAPVDPVVLCTALAHHIAALRLRGVSEAVLAPLEAELRRLSDTTAPLGLSPMWSDEPAADLRSGRHA